MELKFKEQEHKEDCLKLQSQLKEDGWIVGLSCIALAWQKVSDERDAQWLIVDDDKGDNVGSILDYLVAKNV